ncbi:MAG: hypothetical protein IT490_01745 [Candidatus Contendobacter sp.]|nr:hypothetical protein [Candidatus Contendobacter sp.]
MDEKQAREIARNKSKDSCELWVVFEKYSDLRIRVSTYSDYMEHATLADDLMATYEDGEQI